MRNNISRRQFLRYVSVAGTSLPALLIGLSREDGALPSIVRAAAQDERYGTGLYGQGNYPGAPSSALFLPTLIKEEN